MTDRDEIEALRADLEHRQRCWAMLSEAIRRRSTWEIRSQCDGDVPEGIRAEVDELKVLLRELEALKAENRELKGQVDWTAGSLRSTEESVQRYRRVLSDLLKAAEAAVVDVHRDSRLLDLQAAQKEAHALLNPPDPTAPADWPVGDRDDVDELDREG